MADIPFGTMAWRYVSGAHLDGKRRTNATWWTRGTEPRHHVNWWTGKPRAHRALWRLATIAVPATWLVAFRYAPTVRLNGAVALTGACLPFALWRAAHWMLARLPHRHVVHAIDTMDSLAGPVTVNDLDERDIQDFYPPNELDNSGVTEIEVPIDTEPWFEAARPRRRKT